MIIDCHGHYTTAPKALEDWRNRQIAGLKDPAVAPKASELQISDGDLRRLLERRGKEVLELKAGEREPVEREKPESVASLERVGAARVIVMV